MAQRGIDRLKCTNCEKLFITKAQLDSHSAGMQSSWRIRWGFLQSLSTSLFLCITVVGSLFYLFKNYLVDRCPFMGSLIPLFWTSGNVSSGFQSQSGQPYSHLVGACTCRFPEIYFWCDTCWPLDDPHGGAFPHMHVFSRGRVPDSIGRPPA